MLNLRFERFPIKLSLLVGVLGFLGKADESIVDPDTAIEIMEQTSNTLMSLSSDAILNLRKGLAMLAEQYTGENCEFVKGFCDNFALASLE